ncbi:MAG TPA: FAD-dependent oxidoreductase, partial [Burkholderiaceae bacterium]|nr:FAD-dependent oxidoreductase [Burkholderiaceae bacterium]
MSELIAASRASSVDARASRREPQPQVRTREQDRTTLRHVQRCGPRKNRCHRLPSLAELHMPSLPYLTLDKDVRQMRLSDIESFAARISGGVLTAADDGFDEGRKVWNATVDRRPALIARCLSDSDVSTAVRFAASHRMLTSVRGGGHHIAGNAVAEGGLMIDLSGMRSIRIDAVKRTARVAAGALLGDFDREAQAHGLATPLGINSTT